MMNDLDPVYGNWTGYGWGAMWFKPYNQDYIRMDFDPELLDLNDVKMYYRNRKNIISLPLVGRVKFYKTIVRWFWHRAVGRLMYRNKTIELNNIGKDRDND